MIRSSKKTAARRREVSELDGYVRSIVMARDKGCVKCGRTAQQGFKMDAAHILPKSHYPLMRFEPYNVMCLCFACHDNWHKQPLAQGEWFDGKFPGRYEALQIAARVAPKIDYALLRIVLKKEAEG